MMYRFNREIETLTRIFDNANKHAKYHISIVDEIINSNIFKFIWLQKKEEKNILRSKYYVAVMERTIKEKDKLIVEYKEHINELKKSNN